MTSTDHPCALVIGEALIDLVYDPRKGQEPQAVPGGSPANVALALSRLGIDTELVAWFGRDAYGKVIREHLEASNVRLAPQTDNASFTPIAKARLDEQGAATYDFTLEWNPPAPIEIPPSAAVVHTGSIGAILEPGSQAVLDAFSRARGRALTTYDPNVRPTLMGKVSVARPIVESFVAQSDVVKVSDEDLAWLYEGLDAADAAQRWVDRFGVALVVVTRGKAGPVAWTSGGVCESVRPAEVKVVDTVGAGDTFMGGLIDALWRRQLVGADGRQSLAGLSASEVHAIVTDASAVADVVVQRRGANPPWAKELGR